jgi:hypothetical protein
VATEPAATRVDSQATILLSTAQCTVEASCRRDVASGDADDRSQQRVEDGAHVVTVSLTGEVDVINADDVHAVVRNGSTVARHASRSSSTVSTSSTRTGSAG